MSDSLEVKPSVKDTSAEETKKIKDFESKAQVKILVGFPSGRQHVQALHKEHRRADGTEYGDYVSYDGHKINPEDIKPMETAELAKMLSLGAHNVPARPFLADAIEQAKPELSEAIKKEFQKLKEGGQPNWEKIGAMAVGKVQEFVRGDYYKSRSPNSKKTIEYKGSDTPLIDGADLVNATAFIVEKQ